MILSGYESVGTGIEDKVMFYWGAEDGASCVIGDLWMLATRPRVPKLTSPVKYVNHWDTTTYLPR